MASCKFNKASLISLIIATALLAGCGGGGSGGTVQGLSAPVVVKLCPDRAYQVSAPFVVKAEELVQGVSTIQCISYAVVRPCASVCTAKEIMGFISRFPTQTPGGFKTVVCNDRLKELQAKTQDLAKAVLGEETDATPIATTPYGERNDVQVNDPNELKNLMMKYDLLASAKAAQDTRKAERKASAEKAAAERKVAEAERKASAEKTVADLKAAAAEHQASAEKAAADLKAAEAIQAAEAAERQAIKNMLKDIAANTINFSNLDVDDKCFASLNLDYTRIQAIDFTRTSITEKTVLHILDQIKKLEKGNISLKRLNLANTTVTANEKRFDWLQLRFNSYSICLSQGSDC